MSAGPEVTREPHRTPAERGAAGKAARKRAPRRSHGAWRPEAGRPDPVAILEEQASDRVPDLVPIRYGRMLESPFGFFRGAAAVMAADLAPTPATGIHTQLCGDAHLANFGLFASADRRLVFDINDFDETLRGPWEWDVKRLAASFAVAGRDRGLTKKQRATAVTEVAAGYQRAMRNFAQAGNLTVWYAHIDAEDLLEQSREEIGAERAATLEHVFAKAKSRDSLRAFDKLAELRDGEPRIASDPPLLVPIEELAEAAGGHADRTRWIEILRDYQGTLHPGLQRLLDEYELVDVARKVVGVGSVGTRAYVALLMGRDERDPLFLQIKEAQESVLERHLQPSPYAHAGERVVAGQRFIQESGDEFLGWFDADDLTDSSVRSFYVRQLKDWKGSLDVERMGAADLAGYGRLCGWTLARAHARSGDRIAIAGYLGRGSNFPEAIVAFAEAYAEQNERDHAALGKAADDGRIAVTSGV